MMRLVRTTLLAVVIVHGVIHAQGPDPRSLLHASAAELAKVNTITYRGVLVQKFLTRPRPDTMTGRVWFARDVRDHEVGGRVRLEPGDTAWHGIFMAYDGEVTAIVNPGKRTMTLADSTIGGHEYILSELNAELVLNALRHEPFEDLFPDSLNVTYKGREVVEGSPCHTIHVEFPDEGAVSDRYVTWWIGIDDGIPKRYAEHVVYNGMVQTRELTLYDVRINPTLSDDLFHPPVPTGFEVEYYDPQKEMAERPKPLPDGVAAPAWTLQRPSGDSVSLADLRGKVVLLDFWGTWCYPCILALPMLQEIHRNYAARGVVVYGIDCHDRRGNPVGMMKEKGITYGLLMNGDSVSVDYHVVAFPTIYVIGVDGEILGHFQGFDEENGYNELAALLDRYLSERSR